MTGIRVEYMVKPLLLSLLLSSAAFADEVVLRNGSVLSGVVREEGDRVVVEMDYGTMTFKKVDVRAIRRGEDVLSQFEERTKTATDVKSMMALADWAKDHSLNGRATQLYQKVIVLDPDQAEARKALGFEKVNGVWLAGDDLMMARGFVKIGGRWVSRQLAEQILAQEAQARIESDRLELARRISDQRHSEEMTRLEIQRENLDGTDRWCWRTGWSLAPGPFGGVVGYILPMGGSAPAIPGVQPLGVPIAQPPSLPAGRR